MRKPSFPRRPLVPLAVSVAVVAAMVGLAPPSVGTTLCQAPPPIVDESTLTPGTMGTAWTVVQGTTPVSFDVTVLGTLKDGIAPGIDFILIQVSGPVIDQTGGIAAGMSGSPVYVGGDLAGSVSYGFYGADHTIGGMTPAAAMENVFTYPETAAATQRPVHLTQRLRQKIAAASATTSLTSAPTVARPLRVPMNVSGPLTTVETHRLQHWLNRSGSPFVVTTGSSVAPPASVAAVGAPPVPGGAIGAVYSFGDATFGAIGTATIVCDDQFVAFGHPFNHSGTTHLALTNADILATITDPSDVFGPFKLGAITDASGSVTQDRLAGIGGVMGTVPTLTPVTSDLSDTTLGTSRAGETDVAWQEYLPYIAYAHTYLNVATVADADGPGSATLNLTVNGTDESGDPWTVEVDDVYASEYDLADEVGYEAVYRTVGQLVFQNFEDVRVDNVSLTGTTTADDLSARVKQVLSKTSVQHGYAARHTIKVHRGGTIDLRVQLLPAGSTTVQTVDLSVKVPNKLHGSGELIVLGGGLRSRVHAKTFQDLVNALNHQPKHSDVTAAVYGRGIRNPDGTSAPSGFVVTGHRVLRVQIVH